MVGVLFRQLRLTGLMVYLEAKLLVCGPSGNLPPELNQQRPTLPEAPFFVDYLRPSGRIERAKIDPPTETVWVRGSA